MIMLTARDSVIDKVSGLDSGAGRLYHQALRHRGTAGPHPGRPAQALQRPDRRGSLGRSPGDGRGQALGHRQGPGGGAHQEGVRPAPPPAGEQGPVLSREALLDSVWGFDFVGETNSVDVYIIAFCAARSTRPSASSSSTRAGRGLCDSGGLTLELIWPQRSGCLDSDAVSLGMLRSHLNGSRTGNDSQFLMEYTVLNTTDGQTLSLEAGDALDVAVVSTSGTCR